MDIKIIVSNKNGKVNLLGGGNINIIDLKSINPNIFDILDTLKYKKAFVIVAAPDGDTITISSNIDKFNVNLIDNYNVYDFIHKTKLVIDITPMDKAIKNLIDGSTPKHKDDFRWYAINSKDLDMLKNSGLKNFITLKFGNHSINTLDILKCDLFKDNIWDNVQILLAVF